MDSKVSKGPGKKEKIKVKIAVKAQAAQIQTGTRTLRATTVARRVIDRQTAGARRKTARAVKRERNTYRG